MKRLVMLLSVVMCLGMVVAISTSDVAAQTLRPCCEGGSQENKPCNTDNNCQGVCAGGARDGKTCLNDSKCPGACIGGSEDGLSCVLDADCPNGTCGPAGTCDGGTCTALCVKGKPPKTPSEPASEWLETMSPVSLLQTCP